MSDRGSALHAELPCQRVPDARRDHARRTTRELSAAPVAPLAGRAPVGDCARLMVRALGAALHQRIARRTAESEARELSAAPVAAPLAGRAPVGDCALGAAPRLAGPLRQRIARRVVECAARRLGAALRQRIARRIVECGAQGLGAALRLAAPLRQRIARRTVACGARALSAAPRLAAPLRQRAARRWTAGRERAGWAWHRGSLRSHGVNALGELHRALARGPFGLRRLVDGARLDLRCLGAASGRPSSGGGEVAR